MDFDGRKPGFDLVIELRHAFIVLLVIVKRKNTIRKLRNENREWVTGDKEITKGEMGSSGKYDAETRLCNAWTSLVMRCITSVSYLVFFNDDDILFCETNLEGANVMKASVAKCEGVSSQLINFDKSLIYFSNNVSLETNEWIGNVLRVRISNNPEKYLGLPTMVGRRKKQSFSNLNERFIK
ncbi:reverse transcriptase [Gossypium australe]|uniref:Reverse transcriptase n=1 Tax=Gossypium australe TaxID=47621 RepID=A0A5B6VZ90_9ROSI|nr:reverse transcriptase [Gossypium australe]